MSEAWDIDSLMSEKRSYKVSPKLAQMKAKFSVGKIYDIFVGKGISESTRIQDNNHGCEVTLDILDRDFEGLCFVNLVDFDMVYGHRNDVPGYAKAMTDFDKYLAKIVDKLRDDDLLIITADHGCDPATPSTDHSREYVPMLLYGKHVRQGMDLKTRSSFADISATILEYFGVDQGTTAGTSFLRDCLSAAAFLPKDAPTDDELMDMAYLNNSELIIKIVAEMVSTYKPII